MFPTTLSSTSIPSSSTRRLTLPKSTPINKSINNTEEDDDGEREPMIEPMMHQLGQHKGVNISIEASDTFAFDSPEMMLQAYQGEIDHDDGIFTHNRICNPTNLHLATYLAAMEATQSAYCTSSGMSAITGVMMHLCKSGGHVVASNNLYAGSHLLLSSFLVEKCQITTTFVDITNVDEVKNAIVEGKTNVLFFESLSNPGLIVADISELSKVAHEKGVKVVVDNTLTPMIISPTKLGADVVVHSLSKYVSGTSDIVAGAICGSNDLVKEMISINGAGSLLMIGSCLSPREAFALLGRLSHMSLRLKEQCKRALKLSEKIKDQLKLQVIYPGLSDHPQNNLFDRMKNPEFGFGGMLCVDMGTTKKAYDLVKNLKIQNFGLLAMSLGYYENLISCPGSFVSDSTQNSKKEGCISPGLVRISIGYSGVFDSKWKQFKKAYKAMKTYTDNYNNNDNIPSKFRP